MSYLELVGCVSVFFGSVIGVMGVWSFFLWAIMWVLDRNITRTGEITRLIKAYRRVLAEEKDLSEPPPTPRSKP